MIRRGCGAGFLDNPAGSRDFSVDSLVISRAFTHAQSGRAAADPARSVSAMRRDPGLWRGFCCAAACRFLWAVVALFLGAVPAFAQAHRIADEAPGLLESGEPNLMIRDQYSLGLDAPPSDLRLMPDGRLLVLAGRQIAMGDGVRWEVSRESAGDLDLIGTAAGVGADGSIYLGTQGGFARVVFGDSGQWRGVRIASWRQSSHADAIVPRVLVQSGGQWFWHTGSGILIQWKPGSDARVVGRSDAIETAFELDGTAYLSDRTTGRLYRLNGDGSMELVKATENASPNLTVTCATPFGGGRVLVGTYARGLMVFDGRTLRPLRTGGLLDGDMRINDVCPTEGGLFAAAVEGLGIVFFDRSGRVVEVVDRAADSRLSHVRKLVPAAGGFVWGLLSEGIVRVEFPSRVSNFEPFIGTGIATAHPYRMDGRLWLMVDGHIERGVYDHYGRITGFETDSPAGCFAYTLGLVGDRLVTGTEHGAFVRRRGGWVCFSPDTVNLRVLTRKPIDGRWLYSAHGQVGWISQGPNGLVATIDHHVPDLDNVYDTREAPDGTIWMEMGNAKLGRVRLINGVPHVDIFGPDAGLPEGWSQAFSVDGRVRFNAAEHIFRFDKAESRFVEDDAWPKLHGGFDDIVGRPGLDGSGRLWITANGAIHVLERTSRGWRDTGEHIRAGFLPYFFTFQPNGVVWMHADHRLARYDPRMPAPVDTPLRALITSVDLPGSGRTIRLGAASLPVLDYSDNSMVVHFVAVGSSPNPIGFEVRLDGGEPGWVSEGASGTAVFNHLKEGSYVLHVRPRAGERDGTEATLAFVVRPPWFRSVYAYVVYGLLAFAFVAGSAWLASYLERRDKERLGRLVAQRTAELADTNERLAAQVDEVRRLSQAIEQSPVGVLLAAPDGLIAYANPRYCEMHGLDGSRPIGEDLRAVRWSNLPDEARTGIADALARGETWHGHISSQLPGGRTLQLRSTVSPIRGTDGATHGLLLLEEDISGWVSDQERRRRLEAQLFQAQKLESLGTLAGGIAHDFNNILTGILGFAELASYKPGTSREVREALSMIRAGGLRAKDLVSQILTFSRKSFAKLEPVELGAVVADALKLMRASTPASIEIVQELESGRILANTTQIHQVVVNLATNAVQSIGSGSGRIEVSVRRVLVDEALAADLHEPPRGPCMRLRVEDDGAGMDAATITRIFDPFFTTKKPGEGTGLGLAIVQGIVSIHGGAVSVRSEPGRGATFDIYFPECQARNLASPEVGEVPDGHGQDVLVVDDEPSIGTMVAMRLVQLNYRPTVFQDPVLALESFTAESAKYHAAITDLTMAHMDGVDLVHALRRTRPDLPVIVMTGYGTESALARIARLTRCEVMQKPFSCDELGRILGRILGAVPPGDTAKGD